MPGQKQGSWVKCIVFVEKDGSCSTFSIMDFNGRSSVAGAGGTTKEALSFATFVYTDIEDGIRWSSALFMDKILGVKDLGSYIASGGDLRKHPAVGLHAISSEMDTRGAGGEAATTFLHTVTPGEA